MSLWTLSDSFSSDRYEYMRSETYARYRPAKSEPSIPKECQICFERIKSGQEIIARLDGRRWSAKHRSCDEMQHAESISSPVLGPVMVDPGYSGGYGRGTKSRACPGALYRCPKWGG